MRFHTAFVALLALTPALCAPVTTPETVDSLAASNKPEDLIGKMGPMADQLVALLKEFNVSNDTRVVVQAPSAAPSSSPTSSSTPTMDPAAAAATPQVTPEATPADPKADVDPAAAPAGPDTAAPPQPEAGNGPSESTSATPADSADPAAAPGPTDSPAEDPAAGGVQRRDVTAEPTSTTASSPTPTSTTSSSSAPATTNKLESAKVLKLREALAQLTMYEKAIETILLKNGQNIEPMPSAKTAGGMAWGLVNGPLMAILGVGKVAKQP